MAFDLDSRIPCVDDGCVGILDGSGRCGTCGRQASAEELAAAGADLTAAAGSRPDGPGSDDEADPVPASALAPVGPPDDEAGADPFDPDRRLCPDGACIGVIGPDDHCKVCGLAADATVSPA